MARNKSSVVSQPNLQAQLASVKWNKVIYDRINEIDKGEESTKPHKPLRLGRRKSFRRRMRSVRVRVSRMRIRIRLSPLTWLRRLADAYVKLMLGFQDHMGSGGGLVMGFQSMYPLQEPGRRMM